MSALTSSGLIIQPPNDGEEFALQERPKVCSNVHDRLNVNVVTSSSSIVPSLHSRDHDRFDRQPTELEKSLKNYYKHNPVVNYGPDAMTVSQEDDSNSLVKLEKNSVEEVFADMVSETPAERSKTLVVLDCANIGWFYGSDVFNATGIRIAISFFKQFSNVEMRAFLPASYLRVKPNGQTHNTQNTSSINNQHDNNAIMQTDDVEYLTELAGSALLTIVPSGDYDDAYILNYARDNCGFIISNDFFNDHVASIKQSQVKRSMKLWLSENRCGYTFVNQIEFMINPQSKLATCLRGENERNDAMGEDSCDDSLNCVVINTTDNQPNQNIQFISSSSGTINGSNRNFNNHCHRATNHDVQQLSPLLGNNTCDTLQQVLKSLSESVTLLHQLNQLSELKHVLLARASILLQVKQHFACVTSWCYKLHG